MFVACQSRFSSGLLFVPEPGLPLLFRQVSGHATGSDAAQAAALHPSGSPVLLAFSEPGHLRAYPVHPHREPRLGPPPEPLPALQAAGEQRALAFSPLGNLLAAGGQVSRPAGAAAGSMQWGRERRGQGRCSPRAAAKLATDALVRC
jgi:hypothetical protein